MNTDRRSFLGTTVAGAASLVAMPQALRALPSDLLPLPQAGEWDLSWANRINAKHRALFDCTEPESGYGVWRANAWFGQYMDVMKAKPAELAPVIILRHNAIVLAMQQPFWEKYGLGKTFSVTHPLTGEATAKNPAMLDEGDGIPAPFNTAAIQKQLARGVTVLACNLALQLDLVPIVRRIDNVSDEVARQRAIAGLIPGVILQPSGVFAAVRAQQAGCAYVKAS
jgi:intracellular sulfur oxidation DsrE/DsrF family protein